MNAARLGGTGSDGAAVLSLGAELTSVRAARRFVQAHCARLGLDEARCDDALLLTSELVTNAVLHGRSEVCLEVAVRNGVVRFSVADENSRHPTPVTEDPDALDGRGLALVEALCERWGVEDRPMGKAVWFELSPR
ncbi:MAG TPA: ATP-binding protein [Mycobacteriales bacterium]|nr:ATP-binding protein [Mycobacteriales bacterium]